MELTDDARAVIAGLIAPEASHINPGGIYAPDVVWDEIHTLFPEELFRTWVTRHQTSDISGIDDDGFGYNHDAGL